MTILMDKAIAAVGSWPNEQQNEAAELLLALDRLGPGTYRASPAELTAIDEALQQIARGERASITDVEAAFSRFHQ